MATKWGIASAGNISKDFATALNSSPDNHQIVAIAARSLVDAQKFADNLGIPRAYEGYEQLAKDPDVEIVYVGTIHPYHYEVSSLMLNAGKHVLCEKPLCMSIKETKQLLELAKQKNLFITEGIWSRCFPVYKKIKEVIKNQELGDLHQLIASFGLPLTHLPRVCEKELGGGVTFDMGCYLMQFALWIFGCEKPEKIIAGGHLNPGGCDENLCLILLFSGNRSASFTAHAKVKLPNEAFVIGTKGTIKVKDFWQPIEYESPCGTFEFPLKTESKYIYDGSQGLIYEADEVRRCLKEGLLESPLIPHKDTLLIAEITQECLEQLGVRSPQPK